MMKFRQLSPVLLVGLLGAGSVVAHELRGSVELVDGKGKRAAGVHQAVISFVPAGGASVQVPAEPFEVVTVRKDFQPHVIAVPAGSTVSFPNQDPILHNVFSVSSGNAFDLGLYRGGENKEAKLSKAGVVQVFCNVHHQMAAYVVVLDTPHFTTPETSGEFVLPDLPAGPGTLTVWHERTKPVSLEIELPAAVPLEMRLEISKKRVPKHLNKLGQPYSRNRRGKAY